MDTARAVDTDWAERAAVAEQAVTRRHLRRLLGLPGTALGVVSWPARSRDRWWLEWHYWWQAHLVDCLVDAELRAPDPGRQDRITAVLRTHRLRNLTGWTNSYHDDMAWLGLAMERAARVTAHDWSRPLSILTDRLRSAWTEQGLPWRRGSDFFNAPANGPAAILMARTGHRDRAHDTSDWLDTVLRDPGTGLIRDGIRADGSLVEAVYSYCQGVTLGLAVELGQVDRAARLVQAVDEHLCRDHVLQAGGGGDGGLFPGILARYLALAATHLPSDPGTAGTARSTARAIVLASAHACWQHRAEVNDPELGALPLFSHRWDRPAPLPDDRADTPERDLSVQLSGWMLLEAAARVH